MPFSSADIVKAVVLTALFIIVVLGADLLLTRIERWIEEDVMPVVTRRIHDWADRRL